MVIATTSIEHETSQGARFQFSKPGSVLSTYSITIESK